LTEKFPGEERFVAARRIAAAQQPARQPGHGGVRGDAAGRLLGLHEDGLLVPNRRGAERRALLRGSMKPFDRQRGTHSGRLYDRSGQRRRAGQRRGSAEHAIPADHCDLGGFAVDEAHDQRDDAAMREVGILDLVAGGNEDLGMHEFKVMQMGFDESMIGRS